MFLEHQISILQLFLMISTVILNLTNIDCISILLFTILLFFVVFLINKCSLGEQSTR